MRQPRKSVSLRKDSETWETLKKICDHRGFPKTLAVQTAVYWYYNNKLRKEVEGATL